ncbi:MAG: hypothetical protein LW809_03315 [Vampirovibrionales bacterium]|nr:hypothetical protein [Vampirovibrionales bacterium]
MINPFYPNIHAERNSEKRATVTRIPPPEEEWEDALIKMGMAPTAKTLKELPQDTFERKAPDVQMPKLSKPTLNQRHNL